MRRTLRPIPIPRPGERDPWPTTRALVDLWIRSDSAKLLRFAHFQLTRIYRILGVVVVE